MREFIKKHNNFRLFLWLFIPVIVFTLVLVVTDGDEMYNFQSVSKMVNGNIIYKDFNVIITPLFFWIGALLLKIFGNYILVFRVYSIIMHLGIYYALYYLFKRFKVSNRFCTSGVLLYLMISISLIYNGANYNALSLLFYILGFMIVLKKPSIKNSILIGFFAYIIFLTKQNVGMYYVIAVVISQIYNYKKESIKYLLVEFATGALLTGATVLVMLYQGNFWDMINYTFLNISNFAGNNLIIQKNRFYIIIITGMVVACIKILFFVYAWKNKNKEYITLSIFSTMLLFTALPIINMYHVEIAVCLACVEFIIALDKIVSHKMSDDEYSEIIKKHKLLRIETLIYMLDGVFYFSAISIILMQISTYKDPSIMLKENVYKYSLVEDTVLDSINHVTSLIMAEKEKGNQVVIISSSAPVYMTYLKINNGDFDLPFNGNLGKEGVDGLINKMKQADNLVVLIDKGKPFWQIPQELLDFIMKHYRKVDDIDDFYIYEKLEVPIEIIDGNSQ